MLVSTVTRKNKVSGVEMSCDITQSLANRHPLQSLLWCADVELNPSHGEELVVREFMERMENNHVSTWWELQKLTMMKTSVKTNKMYLNFKATYICAPKHKLWHKRMWHLTCVRGTRINSGMKELEKQIDPLFVGTTWAKSYSVSTKHIVRMCNDQYKRLNK